MDHPWITKRLQNACKKKNKLYRDFIKQRTEEAENKYKCYKNKLTNILRTSKKKYYHKLLDDNKNNVREIWKILNNVIKNGPTRVNYPNFFLVESIYLLERFSW